MNGTTTQTVRNVAFDGPFSLPWIVVIAIGLALVFAWSLHRERAVLGSRWTALFGLLRVTAIASVLWMLLAPVSVTVQTSSTRQAIAIATDISGSMQTVDPAGTSDDVRWRDPDEKPTSIESIDRAVIALAFADRELDRGIVALRQHRSEGEVAKHLLASRTAIDRVQSWMAAIENSPESIGHTTLIRSIKNGLADPEFASFAELTRQLSKGATPSRPGWQEGLKDLQHKVSGVRGVADELARRLARVMSARSDSDASIEGLSRGQRVDRFLRSIERTTLAELQGEVQVDWGAFDTAYRQQPPPSTSTRTSKSDNQWQKQNVSSTDLSSVLQHLRRREQQQPLAAAFVFSDVAHHGGDRAVPETDTIDGDSPNTVTSETGDPLQLASSLSRTPVYIIPIGNPSRLRDVNLVGIEAPSVAMRNDDIVIEAHVEAYQCDGERVVVQLMKNAEVVDFRELQIDDDFSSRSVRFEQRVGEIGEQSFEIAVAAVDGETTQQNNFDKLTVNVTRNEIKVLLADEMPRWEFRYLAQLFRRDPKVDCDEMLFRPRRIATGKRESSGEFPTTVDQWDQYDVVILGDLPIEHLPTRSQTSLVQYLRRRGGTLITIAGSRAMPAAFMDQPLGQIIPVDRVQQNSPTESEYAFRVTDEGATHTALMIGETQAATRSAWDFVNRFSPLHEVSPWRQPKPSARSLIAVVPRDETSQDGSDQNTFLCWQPVGRGRMVYLSGPDTYRLRFLRGDQLHFRFWGQLLRWAIAADLASGSEYVRVRASKLQYTPAENVRIEVRLMDNDGSPVIDASDAKLNLTSTQQQRVIPLIADPNLPGTYFAETKLSQAGAYLAQPIGATIDRLRQNETGKSDQSGGVSFTVQADLPMEMIDTRCDHAMAAKIADLTGGHVLKPSAVAEVLALTNLSPIVTETVQRSPRWTQWRYLWLVFGCLQVEWVVRKWRGLS